MTARRIESLLRLAQLDMAVSSSLDVIGTSLSENIFELKDFSFLFLNVCPFDYTAVAGSGEVGP